MIFPTDINITSIIGLESEFKKTESVFVPGRTFHGLTYRASGKISIIPEENSKRIISEKGCITFVPKGCSYNTKILEDGRMLVLHFEALQSFEGLSPFAVKPTYPVAMENLFKGFFEEYRHSDGKLSYSCLSAAYKILAAVSVELSREQSKFIPLRMKRIKEYIDEGYGSTELTIPALAEKCGISEVYFRKEFRECYGTSPLEYIKKVRIENAKGYLSSGLYRVTDIATMCGFDSISYFSYEFKRLCGEAPVEFSKRFIKKDTL